MVILILAGVTLNVTLGENGILNKSKEAANRMNNLVKEDETELNELLNELNETMDSNWNSNTEIPEGNTTPTPNPEPNLPTELENVTGIQNETVKVKDKYENVVTIPKGFEVVKQEGTTVPDGIVIQDVNGNQFVWIPVGRVYKDATKNNYSDIQLGRYTFNTSNGTPTLVQSAYTEETPDNYKQLVTIETYYQEYATRSTPDGLVNSNHLYDLNAIANNLVAYIESVKNNGGYYIARYEASYGEGSSVVDYKPLSKISTATNFNASTVGSLWTDLTQIDAAKISRNMYKNDGSVGVESDLINSYAYDTAIVFIQEMGHTNYANKTSINTSIANTGTIGDKVCNIHDMASNCFEWSTEYSTQKDSKSQFASPCVIRGGLYNYNYSNSASRIYRGANHKISYVGFRTLIYVK